MLTASARRAQPPAGSVSTVVRLRSAGWTYDAVRAQLAAGRWQRFGRVVVCHGGPLRPTDRRAIALLNCGPRAVLTAFSAVEQLGLRGWEREPTHVLVPAGARVRRVPAAPVRIHRAENWTQVDAVPGRRLHRCAPALVRAAGTFDDARPACGIVAAGVQQRLVTVDQLRAAVAGAPRTRHRRLLAAAIEDIAQGAHALSEIDFARLCRKHGLPEPRRQRIRRDPSGRRRYLDVEWRLPDGRRVVAEIDGAMHIEVDRWWDDQLRQNEIAIGPGTTVLRFPSAVVRAAPHLVADQLRRALARS